MLMKLNYFWLKLAGKTYINSNNFQGKLRNEKQNSQKGPPKSKEKHCPLKAQ